MIAVSKMIRTTGRVNKSNGLEITGLPLDENTPVEIIIIPGTKAGDEISEEEWMRGLASNPVFDFLKNPAEDIYTFEDGTPYNAEK